MRRATFGLRYHLVVLVLAAVLPLLAFAGFMIQREIAQQREELQRSMLTTVRALSLAVDREVAIGSAVLQTLAGSPALDKRDFKEFHFRARQAAGSFPDHASCFPSERPAGHKYVP